MKIFLLFGLTLAALFRSGSPFLRRPVQQLMREKRKQLGRLYVLNKPLPSLVEVFDGPTQLQISLCSEFMDIATSEVYHSGEFFVAVSGDTAFEILRGLKNHTSSLWWKNIHIFHLDWKHKATMHMGAPAESEVGAAFMRELGLNHSVPLLSTYNEWTSDMDRYDYIGAPLKRPVDRGGLPEFDYVLLCADTPTGFNAPPPPPPTHKKNPQPPAPTTHQQRQATSHRHDWQEGRAGAATGRLPGQVCGPLAPLRGVQRGGYTVARGRPGRRAAVDR
jgi:hypothetical protein